MTRVEPGARWRRTDLHLHTPGVNTFRSLPGLNMADATSRERVVAAYVAQLQKEGIEVCAITDYNGIRREWFEPIRSLAASRGITVFPGAELAFALGKHGLHILVVFDESVDLEGVNATIRALDSDPATAVFDGTGGHRRMRPKENLPGPIEMLRQSFDCLVIVPHPDQENGLLKSFQPLEAAKLLQELRPDAIEHCPEKELTRLGPTGALPRGYLEGLSRVEFSDPKCIEEIGTKTTGGDSRSTCLRLSTVSISALRLALHDPETRLHLGPLAVPTHARLLRTEITGAGFLRNQVIEWNDDLNVLIGGRGAGKSAIIEVVRYGLGCEPYSDQLHRQALVKNALGSGGKVATTLERPLGGGRRSLYRIERVHGEQPRVYDADTDRLLSVPPGEACGPLGTPAAFGQREIYEVAEGEGHRLRLLDDLIGDEARQRAGEVRDALNVVEENAKMILGLKARLAKREEHQQRLKTIAFEIDVYTKHGVADKLKDATAFRHDEQLLKAAGESLKNLAGTWSTQGDDVVAHLKSAAATLRKGQSRNKSMLAEAATSLEQLGATIEGLVKSGNSEFEQGLSGLRKAWTEWKAALLPLDEELNRVKQEIQTASLDPDRLLKLTEEKAQLEPLLEELKRVEADELRARSDREALLDILHKKRLGEHELRRDRAEAIGRLLRERLRLKVDFKGQKEGYGARLAELLKGSGVSADAVEKLTAPDATDGIALARAVRAGTEALKETFQITAAMAERLARWLTEDEARLLMLETLIPSDALHVELRVDKDYRPLDRLSVGQRATAILLLLFALEGRILILDQPEDDLDNRFVAEDIVPLLREQKGLHGAQRRRLVIATHNANIPVLGDAELVLPLEAVDGAARIQGSASIDEDGTRRFIKQIMEGGDEAFRMRAEKYGRI